MPTLTPRRRASTVAALAGGVLLTQTALATAPAGASTSQAECASIVQLVVRGSTEPAGSSPNGNVYRSGGLGMMGGIAASVASRSGKAVRTSGLNYPADIWPSGSSLGYLNSLNLGRDRLAAELKRLSGKCSNTRFVLVGYSQGAHVIGDVMSNANPEGLSATVRAKVHAIFLTGDPVRRRGEPWNRGTGPGGGALPNRGAGQFSAVASRVVSYCYRGDIFCDPGNMTSTSSGQTIHRSYGNSTVRTYGSNFIIGKIG